MSKRIIEFTFRVRFMPGHRLYEFVVFDDDHLAGCFSFSSVNIRKNNLPKFTAYIPMYDSKLSIRLPTITKHTVLRLTKGRRSKYS